MSTNQEVVEVEEVVEDKPVEESIADALDDVLGTEEVEETPDEQAPVETGETPPAEEEAPPAEEGEEHRRLVLEPRGRPRGEVPANRTNVSGGVGEPVRCQRSVRGNPVVRHDREVARGPVGVVEGLRARDGVLQDAPDHRARVIAKHAQV